MARSRIERLRGSPGRAGACLAVGIQAAALGQGIAIRSLELDIEADLATDHSGGSAALPPTAIGFDRIRVPVRLDADASHKTLAAIVKRMVLRSPVANTLHDPVHLDVALAGSAAAA